MRKNLVISLTALLLMTFITSYLNMAVVDVVSLLFLSVVVYTVHYNTKEIKVLKGNWQLLIGAAFIWLVADGAWLVYESLGFFMSEDNLYLSLLYAIPNVLLLISSLWYFYFSKDKWSKRQLTIEFTAVTLIIGIIVYALFLVEFDIRYMSLNTLVNMFYLITDVVILVLVMTMIISSRYIKVKLAIRHLYYAFIVYVIADFIYLWQRINDAFTSNALSDALFLFAFFTIAIASHHASKEPNEYFDYKDKLPLNYGRSKILWLALVAPIILLVTGSIEIIHFSMILLVLVIYQVTSHYVQLLMMTEVMYDKEHEMTLKLEEEIKERTRELLISKEALEKRAITDSLTGLFNRDYFNQELLDRIERQDVFTVAYLDLDKFKIINDLHGHHMGDRVLIHIAKLFGNHLSIDYEICRIGGDEFALIIPGDSAKVMTGVSQLIKELLDKTIVIGKYSFQVEASLGFARYPKDAGTASDLVKSADIAMYHAKNEASDVNHVFYTSRLVEGLERRNHIEMLLSKADFENDFELYYQPQFDAKSEKITGMEALIRWNHIEEGFISPGEFIPIAEETGLILQIHDFVYKAAIKQLSRWHQLYNDSLVMCINLPPMILNSDQFYNDLEGCLNLYRMKPERIEFEITEHSAMNTSIMMAETFKKLKDLGISIAIDDFGTGYSSLSYLKRFDVETLKIAKELIFNIEEDEDVRLIVKAIIMMADGLKLSTIAEGVETKEQLIILKSLGCDIIQGYYLGRPLDSETFENMFLKS
ncbi:EAL domain-containing protein [Acidaminobacter sp. JC074]|uniref:putative bifunctional diguanylate cyclase/phosphodiesterase n=1 Tax=Acidaminobacter sp. JC074 TaxID=2530199 RepID=UPI001F0F1AF9|nr:GGDEF domain-containing phosphodiesterase [Acidaminobacter sp. JC074]MCH4887571.1 EAL domain-containing protein [Acidaminobacter sp. JC074]